MSNSQLGSKRLGKLEGAEKILLKLLRTSEYVSEETALQATAQYFHRKS